LPAADPGHAPGVPNGIDPDAVAERLERAKQRAAAARARRDNARERMLAAQASARAAISPAEAERYGVEARRHGAAVAFHDNALADFEDAIALLERHLSLDRRAQAAGTMTAIPQLELDRLLRDEYEHSVRMSARALEEMVRLNEGRDGNAHRSV
jgi:hypothetical protein